MERMFKGDGPLAMAEREAELATVRAKAEALMLKLRAEQDEAAQFHTVTVTTSLVDAGTEDEWRQVDQVTFTCTAPEDADCRNYPISCGCEYFEYNEARTHDAEGHPRTTGNQCWMQDWFENDGAIYEGADADDRRDDNVPAIDRTGHVTITPGDEWIEWEYVPVAEQACTACNCTLSNCAAHVANGAFACCPDCEHPAPEDSTKEAHRA